MLNIKVRDDQQFSDFDPFSEAFRADPPRYHEQLLQASPGFMMMEGHVPSAYVANFEQCQQVMMNSAQFSSVKPEHMPGMQRVDFFNGQPVMNYSDAPQHTRLRRTVNVAFSPARVQKLVTATEKIIDELLGQYSEGQHLDAFSSIARPLAIKVLFEEFLGIPFKDQSLFFAFGSTFISLDALKLGDPKPQAYLDAWEKGEAYCRQALAQAEQDKSDNILGMIAAASETGALSDAEIMAMMCVLFTGGVPTVTAMAGSAMYHLAKHPDIAERIRQDPALAKPFCEEVFRLDAPVTMVIRFATEDVELGEQVISKGMPVSNMISVANRDPKQYEDPTAFNIDRPKMRHLAFGSGVHVCIGNSITRATLPLFVQSLAKRAPNLRLDPNKPSQWRTTPRSRHRFCVPIIY